MRALSKVPLVQIIILVILIGAIMSGFGMIAPNLFFYPVLESPQQPTSSALTIPFMPQGLSNISVTDNETDVSPAVSITDITAKPEIETSLITPTPSLPLTNVVTLALPPTPPPMSETRSATPSPKPLTEMSTVTPTPIPVTTPTTDLSTQTPTAVSSNIDGTKIYPDGTIVYPNGTVVYTNLDYSKVYPGLITDPYVLSEAQKVEARKIAATSPVCDEYNTYPDESWNCEWACHPADGHTVIVGKEIKEGTIGITVDLNTLTVVSSYLIRPISSLHASPAY